MTNKMFYEIRNETYTIANQTPGSGSATTGVLGDVDSIIKETITDVCNSWKWQFLSRSFLFETYESYTLSIDLNPGDVIIPLPDNILPTTGFVYIEGEVIPYLGNTGNALTGCTIASEHDVGDTIEYVRPIPADYGREPNLKLDQTPYNYVNQVDFDGNYSDKIWTIVYDDSENDYIRVKTNGNSDFVLWYQKAAPEILHDRDITVIPDPYSFSVVARIAAGKAMILRFDDPNGLGQIVKNMGENELLKMQKYYGQREEPVSKRILSSYRANRPRRIRVNG